MIWVARLMLSKGKKQETTLERDNEDGMRNRLKEGKSEEVLRPVNNNPGPHQETIPTTINIPKLASSLSTPKNGPHVTLRYSVT